MLRGAKMGTEGEERRLRREKGKTDVTHSMQGDT